MILSFKHIRIVPLNALYQPIIRLVRGKPTPSIILSSRAKECKKLLTMMALRQKPKKPLTGKLSVKIDFCYKGKKRGDADSGFKLLFDALEGIIFTNDSQIVEIISRSHTECGENEINMIIEEID